MPFWYALSGIDPPGNPIGVTFAFARTGGSVWVCRSGAAPPPQLAARIAAKTGAKTLRTVGVSFARAVLIERPAGKQTSIDGPGGPCSSTRKAADAANTPRPQLSPLLPCAFSGVV